MVVIVSINDIIKKAALKILVNSFPRGKRSIFVIIYNTALNSPFQFYLLHQKFLKFHNQF